MSHKVVSVFLSSGTKYGHERPSSVSKHGASLSPSFIVWGRAPVWRHSLCWLTLSLSLRAVEASRAEGSPLLPSLVGSVKRQYKGERKDSEGTYKKKITLPTLTATACDGSWRKRHHDWRSRKRSSTSIRVTDNCKVAPSQPVSNNAKTDMCTKRLFAKRGKGSRCLPKILK